MRTVTTREHYVTIPETDTEVLVSGPLPDHQSEVVHALTRDDGTIVLSWKVQDTDPMEYDWQEGVVFKDFRNHYDGGGQSARDAFIADMIEKYGEEHVHLVEVYSHGLESFSRVDRGVAYPDRQWDVCAACVLVTPDDVTSPTEFADAVLAEYTSWCCGDVYGVVSVDVPADYDGAELDCEAVWGMIGYEYADECVKAGGY